jgi:hypothetical protein
MAFVVATKRGGFEIRESRNTEKGPRSQTLASFDELSDEVIEKARARAAKPPSAAQLRQAAKRAGAPEARAPIDRAARELIAELGKGRRLDPTLRQLLLDQLDGKGSAVAEWIASTPKDRGRALVDLLLLGDAIPSNGRQRKPLQFPRLDSTADGRD